jgi:2,4-diketo-3-deoxy-L-fuconate hydrolase
MKLLRYGPKGHELPEVLDDNGHIRDLSGEARGISEEVLLPLSLDRLGVQHQSVLAAPLVSNQEIPTSGSASTKATR